MRQYLPVVVGAALLVGITILVARDLMHYQEPLWVAVPVHLVGVTFVVGGTALWVQRPGIRLGPMCVLLGSTWYAGALQGFSEPEVVYALGFVFYHLNVAVFAHLVLSVPTGRLGGQWERLVVGVLYVTTPAIQLIRYLGIRSVLDRSGFGDVTNHYTVWAAVGTAVGAPLALATAVLAVRHYRGADPVVRRPYGLFWTAAAATGVTAFAAAVAEVGGHQVQRIALVGYALALMGTAVGLVLGASAIRIESSNAISALAGEVDDLEPAIRVAVGDTKLHLFTWVPDRHQPEGGSWVRDQQRLPTPGRSDHARTELRLGGQPVVLLVHNRELAYQRLLMDAVTAMTFAAITRRRLHERQRQAAEQGQQVERMRIGEAIHNQIQTPLLTVVERLRAVAERTADDPEIDPEIDKALDGLATVQTWVRRIARNYYPEGLEAGGLNRSLRSWTRGASLSRGLVRLDITDCRWPLPIEFAAHQIACEAVQNAIRHSGGSRVLITAVDTHAGLEICVDDNGSGFTVGPERPRSGLWQMRWRAESVGGYLSIGPPPDGHGTRVRVVLPGPMTERRLPS